ncbi:MULTISPECIES: VOC family protein [unclassified Roseitalea]|uniref:VOC family protein n=1 Tax=unclassified Roseitalea TaxID=2639107 RepID=UPI00273D2493|nr:MULTISPECIES: VOC family protein [unclassified Roseitalea]
MTAHLPYQPRALDHCVLPVDELSVARDRLTALGFTVAPDARHPFGTENACVFFADGTYLEPLAVGQREDCERTAQKGNVFTARDQAYRFRNGEPGFSAVAFATETADADHSMFREQGISAGRKLIFGRTMEDASGASGRATFKNAFAADLRSPDSFFFTCQRVTMPQIDRSGLTAHENGATGIAAIIASELNPTDFQYFLQPVINNRDTEAASFGVEIDAANARIEVMTPEGLRAHFGVDRADRSRGIRLEGIVLTVADVARFRARIEDAGVPARACSHFLVVDRAPGQGAFFAVNLAGSAR